MAAANVPGAGITSYDCEIVPLHDEGLVQVPINGDTDGTQSSIFVRIHSPIERMVVSWEAIKNGGIPKIPSPLTFSNVFNVVYLSKTGPSAPIPIPTGVQGSKVWCIRGSYIFGLRKPRPMESSIPTGKMYWESESASENTIPGSMTFDKTLLDTGPWTISGG